MLGGAVIALVVLLLLSMTSSWSKDKGLRVTVDGIL
jgi:hypothetical protein